MIKGFVKFTACGAGKHPKDPAITFSAKGQAFFNRMVKVKFLNNQNFEVCDLYFDAKKKKLGFHFTNIKTDTSYNIQHGKSGSMLVQCTALFKFYDLEIPKRGTKFMPKLESENFLSIIYWT
jgi:hypothetical protein